MENKFSEWQGKTALVTGASSGIGEAVARKLAGEGLKVILAARREMRIIQLAAELNDVSGTALAFPVDLAKESDRIELSQFVKSNTGGLDVLVNNAGLGWYGYYAHMPWAVAMEMLQVNITAVIQLTSLFLPEMQSRGSGHIVNIGSIAGSLPSQGVALYSASKSFLDAFTTSLYRELHGSKVHVSVLRAGPVRTEFFETAATRPSGDHIPAEKYGISAELVAHRLWGVLQRPQRIIYVPRVLAVVPWIELLFGWLEDRIGPLLLKRRSSKV
jgi:short-subunit dehydrogenase